MTDFWHKPLAELNRFEWEQLCDGCGCCCLVKLEDEDTGELFFTNVACELLDQEQCRCEDYSHRAKRVTDCLVLERDNFEVFQDLPDTCAYRLRAEGKPLPDWHPLITGDPGSVHDAGISVRGRVVSESYIHPDQLEEHVITWVVPGKR